MTDVDNITSTEQSPGKEIPPATTYLSYKRYHKPPSRNAKKIFVRLFHPYTKELLLDDYVTNQDQLDDILSQLCEAEDIIKFLPSKRSFTPILKDGYNPLERLCDGFKYLILEFEPSAKRTK